MKIERSHSTENRYPENQDGLIQFLDTLNAEPRKTAPKKRKCYILIDL
ncbi:MAG: hypothetical protein JKY09_06505 [Crocinitomicaceae bacterium]|nr:hypothetical protein [Crocinitomicaceae bacterium]